MASALRISIGQHTDKGRKEINQDFHGALVPEGRLLETKGIAAVVADGISTSPDSREAAETAVKSFLSDYFATPDGWSVKQSGDKVLSAANAWLYGRTRSGDGRYDHDRGFVSTFTALILKGCTAHVLHVGDARVYRLTGGALSQLTRDHCVRLDDGASMLERALGIAPTLKIDYCAVPFQKGDVFLLATDEMASHLARQTPDVLQKLLNEFAQAEDLDQLARQAIARAVIEGANDNLTVQILRVDALPETAEDDLETLAGQLPVPVDLQPGQVIDGWRLLELVHVTQRSQLFKAQDPETGKLAAFKVPAASAASDPAFLQSFLMEEWVARRLNNRHLMRTLPEKDSQRPARTRLYTTFEWIPGLSLTRWMEQNPEPDMAVVFGLVSDIAKALQAMHRHQMVHQDLRPDNVMITPEGRAVLIDFGSTHVLGSLRQVAGLPDGVHGQGLATHQYMAPEGFFGVPADPSFDIYSLGVIAYQMLTGKLPYGADMARAASPAAQLRVAYRPASGGGSRVPVWADAALRKAVHPDPAWRYREPSEFIADLSQPNPALPGIRPTAIAARDPVRFWQLVSLCLAVIVFALLYRLSAS